MSDEKPQNFEELKDKARRELLFRVWQLEERASRLKEFLDDLKYTDINPDNIDRLASDVVRDNEDHLTPSICEIYTHWPHIASKPGEGYW